MLTFPNIDPVALSLGSFSLAGKTIGPINIHWYGLAYLAGFALGWFLAYRRCSKRFSVVKPNQLEDLVFYSAMGVVLGARIGYVLFYNFDAFLSDPISLFKVWEGGMSFHGGLIGFAIAMIIYGKRHGRHFLDMVDFVALYATPGLFFGRIANFIGSELYGRASDVPWAMIFPKDPTGLPRHPSQLYEAFLEGIVLFAILWWFSRKPRPRGAVIGLFVLLYGCFRFFVEFFREPDAHISFDMLGWVTRGQELCVPMILIGAGLLYWAYKKPTPIFEETQTNSK
jgi:phosphatidylglycerol---prolipoprotein diacylglyceryl transferase